MNNEVKVPGAAFLQGVVAGYGIAVPVGAIAILIVERGLRRGFWNGFAAGAGAASADLLYAGLAAVVGQALAAWLAPYAAGLRGLSAAVLIGMGVWGLWRALRGWKRAQGGTPAPDEENSNLKVYAQFVGLTLLNPLTVAYFAALILGGGTGLSGWAARAAFVAGAALASLSWQSLLAGIGALGHRHLSPGLRLGVSLVGNLIVLGLGLRMLL